MGYKESLQAAGAKIVDFGYFGSWEGNWWALVMYEGRTGWIHDYFGSCSVCDAYEAEFGWDREDAETEEERFKRLVEFGKTYLDDLMTQEQAEKRAGRDLDWDLDAEDMLEFVEQYRDVMLVSLNL